MRKIAVIYLASMAICLCTCKGPDCDQLPTTFSSYEVAIETIQKANFEFRETINTARSSWIEHASFYSCDGNYGFFTLKTEDREYIYSGVPIAMWEGFKGAASYGSYYNKWIKGNFPILINK